jgi:hypothetical protein
MKGIKSSSWNLSGLWIADLGYVLEFENVLLEDWEIARLEQYDPEGYLI